MSRRGLRWHLLLVLVLFPVFSAANEHPDRYQRFDVDLLTVGPGALYWERFGHNAILIRDRITGEGITYNFGMFDFGQKNFMLNFARGLMTYRAIKYRADADLASYVAAGRAVWVQRLNLEREQKNRLIDYLNWHTSEGNQDYRYHYFKANCSTKVRDALDHAFNGRLSAHFSALPSSKTRRQFVRELTAPVPWLFTSTLLALGRPVDQVATRWDDFFIPMEMREAFADPQLSLSAKTATPMVASTRLVNQGTARTQAGSRPVAQAAIVGFFLACLVVGATRFSALRWFPYSWLLVAGTAGLVLTGLWLLTDHDAAHWNENVLLLCPLLLLVWLGVWRRARWAYPLMIVLAVVGSIVGLSKPVGLMYQDNLEVVALSLPVLWACVWWVRHQLVNASAQPIR